VRRSVIRPASAPAPLHVRRAAAGALRSRRRESLDTRHACRPRREHVALSRADAALRRRTAGDAGRGMDAARPRPPAGPGPGARALVRQGRIPQSNQLVQGARAVGCGDAGEPPRGERPLRALSRQRRQCHGCLCGGGRNSGARLHAARREGAVHPRMRAIRSRRPPGRRPHHGRRPRRRRTGTAARLVRHVDPEGATTCRP
jgi:hypothetical protein